MIKKTLLLFLVFFCKESIPLHAQSAKSENVWTADNKNGTFKNPLLWGDWPDPDVIRVDDTFYFISTSMHYVPGCPILKSKDLVNWEMAGYAVDKYNEDPRYNFQGGDRYLRGSWAATIRHHKGLFYVGFCTPNWDKEKGNFSICTSKDINGPWKRTIFPEYLYDPGLFFDDDGKVYVAHGQQKLYITELNADALSVKTPQKEIYNNRDYPYLEGSHVYKIKGKYYILGSTGGTQGRQVCLRSDNIYGPYESKVIINDDHTYPGNGLHQGGMLQLKDGSWWFIIMQDRGAIGRTPNLEPVTWVDGWPMLGINGKGVETHKKPDVGKVYPVTVPATSDEFNTSTLGLQWQWNHNPAEDKWSLKERKGYLRLHALPAKELTTAVNTLSQRVQGPASEGTVEMEVSGLKDGNIAGFGIFQSPYAYIAIRKKGNKKTLLMVNNGKVIDSIPNFLPNKLWLKANATHIGFIASFSYSVDGKKFIPFGNQLNMGLGLDWTANRFALFNYSTKNTGAGGYADFNWFRFKGENPIPNNQKVTYDGNSLKIDGKETFVYSAAFHYFRCPKELWRDRFKKIKAAGFNTVETYIPWNWHERNMPKNINDYSQIDFSDLQEWLQMAQNEFGLYTIVRPGPFICAEWAGGGYPRWLAKFRPEGLKDFWLRSNDPEHVKWSLHWYKAVNNFIANEQISHKKKGEKGIILVQIENEYDSDESKDKTAFLQSLYRSVKDAGITVPIFTCLTEQCRGSKDSLLSDVFDCDNYYVGLNDAISCAKRMSDLKHKQPNAPGFVTELQGGWFSTVAGRLGEDHESDHRHFYAIGMMSILGGATGLNDYMFYGGTHFDGWGARGQTTSYDYNAAIRENGSLSKKYIAARNIGSFIKKYEQQLIHAKGGICAFENVPDELKGGVRIASDGTKFVFLHNSSAKKKLSGTALVKPGVDADMAKPIYNVNQNEEKVLITTAANVKNELSSEASFEVEYTLDSLETKVLVIPPKAGANKGFWWSMQEDLNKQVVVQQPKIHIPIKEVQTINEDFNADWKVLSPNVSLPEMGVNDSRYVLYRSQDSLTQKEAKRFVKLLFNTYSRDVLNVQVNGKLATRLYPTDKYAAVVTRNVNKSFERIKDNEYDNIFDVAGLLHAGENEITVVYENIGHEHGYYPMEELSGIKTAGLSDTTTMIQKVLKWKVATNLAGIDHGFVKPEFAADKWNKMQLDTAFSIPRKGNGIQPQGKQTALFTWYRAEFELPANADPATTWRMLINASGNGYMYLNGHNIGRHWEAGPQREFYLPECWLNFGKDKKNVITFGLRQTMNGAVIKGMEITEY
ncbi:beta-galactosidase [Pedobacter gandavensis]|nr:beta-galactosidase [Pedobacter gandavensis]